MLVRAAQTGHPNRRRGAVGMRRERLRQQTAATVSASGTERSMGSVRARRQGRACGQS